MLLTAGPVRALGVPSPRLHFTALPPGGNPAGGRQLLLDDRPAFDLSFWCGTCPLLFQRQQGANDTCSLPALEGRLADGLDDLDDAVISAFGSLLPVGDYLPLLLSVRPALVLPAGPGDYFAFEQVATWGLSSFWGLPEYPATPYYRTYETRVDADAHLYEFVVPMVPPAWNDAQRVAQHAEQLRQSSAPTAVAVSVLDVCEPAGDYRGDQYAHWGLVHFLLDGHHKMEGAARTGRPLRLLSLVAVGEGLASAEQVAQLPRLRAQPPAARSPA